MSTCHAVPVADAYPQVTELSYEDCASVDCTITRNGYLALDDEMMSIALPQDFTIHLAGESEHRVLASLFRDAAAVLDRD